MNANAHIAAALQALRNRDDETEEQTIALDKAVELLQGGPVEEATPPPAFDPEALQSAIAGSILAYTESDAFKAKLDAAVAAELSGEDAEARFDDAVTRYLESDGGKSMMTVDFNAFLESAEGKSLIAGAGTGDLSAEIATFFQSDAGTDALLEVIDKQFAADIADAETPLGKLAVSVDGLKTSFEALDAEVKALPAPAVLNTSAGAGAGQDGGDAGSAAALLAGSENDAVDPLKTTEAE